MAGSRAIIRAFADVAQLARASACHAEGRGFESLHPLVAKGPLRRAFRVEGDGFAGWARVRGYHSRVPTCVMGRVWVLTRRGAESTARRVTRTAATRPVLAVRGHRESAGHASIQQSWVSRFRPRERIYSLPPSLLSRGWEPTSGIGVRTGARRPRSFSRPNWLERCQTSRAQYLRIKGVGLTAAADAATRSAGRDLLRRVVTEYPSDALEATWAHRDLGRILGAGQRGRRGSRALLSRANVGSPRPFRRGPPCRSHRAGSLGASV